MKKMKRGFLLGILAACLLFSGCDAIVNAAGDVAGSSSSNINGDEIRKRVYNNAKEYEKNTTKYEKGGIGGLGVGSYSFDNIGFVTRCYKDALSGTGYKLNYEYDSNNIDVNSIKDSYSDITTSPKRGDLVFIKENDRFSYVGIFDNFVSGNQVQYISAQEIKKDVNIDGIGKKVVSIRKTDRSNTIFGVMKVTKIY